MVAEIRCPLETAGKAAAAQGRMCIQERERGFAADHRTYLDGSSELS